MPSKVRDEIADPFSNFNSANNPTFHNALNYVGYNCCVLCWSNSLIEKHKKGYFTNTIHSNYDIDAVI